MTAAQSLSHIAATTWIKICGLTTPADAAMAAQAGADALGFNCYEPSPRYVSPQLVGELSRAVTATRVALFVDAPGAQIEEVLKQAEIDLLQFHGDEDRAFCESWGLPYMKVLRMREGVDFNEYAQQYESAWALMLDTYVPGKPGGTGQQFDWSRWPSVNHQEQPHEDAPRPPLVLAGGLDVSNVAAAVRELQPFGVDVSGGVEGSVKGLKDDRKVMEFIQEVRRVGREQRQ